MVNIEEVKQFAQKQPKTKDYTFNKGRADCIAGNITTDAARYFLQCTAFHPDLGSTQHE